MHSYPVSRFAEIVSGPGADAWEIHRRANQKINNGEDVVLLTIGEDVSDTTPDEIVEQAVASLRAGRHHYPSVQGLIELREAIARRHTKQTGRVVEADNVVVFAGAQNALFANALCLLQAGDRVVVIEPYYSTYPATFSSMGSEFIAVPADASRDLLPDIDRLRAAMTDSTRLLVVNSPNNPTGAVYSKECLQALWQICRDHDCWLLSDEVYADFVYEDEHCSMAELADINENMIVVSSLSKSHRMAGWRIGWAIAPKFLTKNLSDLNLAMNYGLPPFVQDAATHAIEHCDHVPRLMAADYAGRAQRVLSQISAIRGVRVLTPRAGMFVMLDVAGLSQTGHEFAGRLLEDFGVAVLPCGSFGSGLDSYLRMSLCADNQALDRACKALVDLAARDRGN